MESDTLKNVHGSDNDRSTYVITVYGMAAVELL